MENRCESIEMQNQTPMAEPPRSQPIDIVRKRTQPVVLPRAPERAFSLADRCNMSNRRSHHKSTSSSDDDSSSCSAKSVQLSIRPFSGEDTLRCVEDFVADIDSEFSRLGCYEALLLDKVKGLLTGKAATVMLTGNFVSWRGLREALLREFSHEESLRHCIRAHDEDVTGFRLRIEETAKREAIRVMIRGLQPEVARIVEAARPKSLMEAACIAAFYESGGVEPEMQLMEGVHRWSAGNVDSPYLLPAHQDFPPKGIF